MGRQKVLSLERGNRAEQTQRAEIKGVRKADLCVQCRMRNLLVSSVLLVAFGAPGALAQSQVSAIEHVTVIDGTGRPPLPDRTVIVSGPRIVAIRAGTLPERLLPQNAKVIDATGKTMIPGLINAHGHLALIDGDHNSATYYTVPHVLAELRQYEHNGVLTMLSLGLNRDMVYLVRRQQQGGSMDGAAVFLADRGIGVPGGAPQLPHGLDQLYQPHNPEEARADVDAAAGRHANFVKVWVDSQHGKAPKMSPAIYTAVIDEAHKNHIPVAAHVYELSDAIALVNAGIDVLAHSVRDQRVSPELIRLMKQHGTYYLPTLTVDSSFFAFADDPALLDDPILQHATSPAELNKLRSDAYRKQIQSDPDTAQHRKDFAMAKKNLRLMERAGVRVGFGTDSGANPVRIPGYAEHQELAMLVDAGLTPLQALHTATQVNAQLLGIELEQGTIAPGKLANFLLLAGDPTKDIRNTRRIDSIWHNGREGKPAVSAQEENAYLEQHPAHTPSKKALPSRR